MQRSGSNGFSAQTQMLIVYQKLSSENLRRPWGFSQHLLWWHLLKTKNDLQPYNTGIEKYTYITKEKTTKQTHLHETWVHWYSPQSADCFLCIFSFFHRYLVFILYLGRIFIVNPGSGWPDTKQSDTCKDVFV